MFTRGRKRKGSRETGDRVGSERRRRTESVALARAKEREGEAVGRGDKTGEREREMPSAGRRRRIPRRGTSHTRTRTPTPTRTHSRSTPADTHRAVKLAHYRLPDSHHELLEKSIEYKKSPWCARRVGALSLSPQPPPPPSSFPSLSLSLSRTFWLPLAPIVLSPSPRAASLARGRDVRVCS